jgi:hypothetical protein
MWPFTPYTRTGTELPGGDRCLLAVSRPCQVRLTCSDRVLYDGEPSCAMAPGRIIDRQPATDDDTPLLDLDLSERMVIVETTEAVHRVQLDPSDLDDEP